MTRTRVSRSHARCIFHQGHTLLEFVVATGLAAMVMGSVLVFYTSERRQSGLLLDTIRMDMDGRAAIAMLSGYGRLSGYGLSDRYGAGEPEASNTRPTESPIELALIGCPVRPLHRIDPGVSQASDVAHAQVPNQPMRVYPSINCSDAQPGRDVLAVFYRADIVSAWRDRRGIPQDCEGRALLKGRPGVVRARFFLRFSQASRETALYCANEGGGTARVERIEQLVFRYWLAAEAAEAAETAGGSTVERRATHAFAAQMRADDWQRVRGFDVCVVVKGAVRSPRSAVKPYRDCFGVHVPAAADGLRRAVYRSSVALRNTPFLRHEVRS